MGGSPSIVQIAPTGVTLLLWLLAAMPSSILLPVDCRCIRRWWFDPLGGSPARCKGNPTEAQDDAMINKKL